MICNKKIDQKNQIRLGFHTLCNRIVEMSSEYIQCNLEPIRTIFNEKIVLFSIYCRHMKLVHI